MLLSQRSLLPARRFYIDPVRPVERALITHGHSDHARSGHTHVLATRETLDIMALRYGVNFAETTQPVSLGETLMINGVRISFHGAGHVLGSAQIAVEMDGTRIVASGDYKRAADPTCAPFEPVACDVFITEATFALPVFRHPDAAHEIATLLKSIRQFPERAHLVGAYSLGKAQRVIKLIRNAGYWEPIYIHGALERSASIIKRKVSISDLSNRPRWNAVRHNRILQERSSSARPRLSPTAGHDGFPIQSQPLPQAGCASDSAPNSKALNCRSSFPTIATGMS